MSYTNFVETIEKVMKSPNQFDKQDWEIWNKMKELYEESLNTEEQDINNSLKEQE
jgi:hypothetical protein